MTLAPSPIVHVRSLQRLLHSKWVQGQLISTMRRGKIVSSVSRENLGPAQSVTPQAAPLTHPRS